MTQAVLEKQANEILKKRGTSLKEIMNIFMIKVVENEDLPFIECLFSSHTPNTETKKALAESYKNYKPHDIKDFDDFIKQINS
ncbi:MAG: type II toxin-antitoxin system RelB/DinJ family antitoxin [Candidatus Peribacteria bacterium]|jgi:antitoxin component of RelBE/YafQ-DinJ toxin-antitoxin module|nr:type II toxin-antitoxin system RelB/DinJ family antitoxin [Candidatus Peribacteria bacterium]